jgi:hypothetical protein
MSHISVSRTKKSTYAAVSTPAITLDHDHGHCCGWRRCCVASAVTPDSSLQRDGPCSHSNTRPRVGSTHHCPMPKKQHSWQTQTISSRRYRSVFASVRLLSPLSGYSDCCYRRQQRGGRMPERPLLDLTQAAFSWYMSPSR